MLEVTLQRQLRGQVERAWRPEGLLCEIALPLAAATRHHALSAGQG
jgi:hypothetical protein